jgi:hypothetical protein
VACGHLAGVGRFAGVERVARVGRLVGRFAGVERVEGVRDQVGEDSLDRKAIGHQDRAGLAAAGDDRQLDAPRPRCRPEPGGRGHERLAGIDGLGAKAGRARSQALDLAELVDEIADPVGPLGDRLGRPGRIVARRGPIGERAAE